MGASAASLRVNDIPNDNTTVPQQVLHVVDRMLDKVGLLSTRGPGDTRHVVVQDTLESTPYKITIISTDIYLTMIIPFVVPVNAKTRRMSGAKRHPIPQRAVAPLLEFIARANCDAPVGCWEFDMAARTLQYRASFCFTKCTFGDLSAFVAQSFMSSRDTYSKFREGVNDVINQRGSVTAIVNKCKESPDQVLPSDATVVYTPPDVVAHGGHARSSSNIVKSSNNINVELPHPDAALTTAAEVCAVVEAVLDAANVTRRKDRNSWIGTLPCKTHTLAIAVHSNTDKHVLSLWIRWSGNNGFVLPPRRADVQQFIVAANSSLEHGAWQLNIETGELGFQGALNYSIIPRPTLSQVFQQMFQKWVKTYFVFRPGVDAVIQGATDIHNQIVRCQNTGSQQLTAKLKRAKLLTALGGAEDVDSLLKPNLCGLADQSGTMCTFVETQRAMARQPFYQCRTCCTKQGYGICYVCRQRCHADHEVVRLDDVKMAFCDCGAGDLGGAPCAAKNAVWACPHCTFFNAVEMQICEMCAQPAPANLEPLAHRLPPSTGSGNSVWKCRLCGRANASHILQCPNCSATRTGSAVNALDAYVFTVPESAAADTVRVQRPAPPPRRGPTAIAAAAAAQGASSVALPGVHRNMGPPPHVVEKKVDNATRPRAESKMHESYEIPRHALDFTDMDIIGKGGMGSVYKADWMGTDVAVKVMNPDVDTPEMRQQFNKEIELQTHLHHVQICQVMGVCYEKNSWLLVTEYCKYGSLHRVLHDPALRQKLTMGVRVRMALQAAQGMVYLHSKNIIHLDLKSLNLLCGDGLSVKVCDFGLSKTMNNTQTRSAALGYTPLYVAPEVFRNEPYGKAADVYAFGIILYEILTLRDPYSENILPPAVLLAQIINGKRPVIPATCRQEFRELMVSCWDAEAKKRPTFLQVVRKLKKLFKEFEPYMD